MSLISKAMHLQAMGPHQCCNTARVNYIKVDGLNKIDSLDRCGLMCGHKNDCVPYTPGEYMPPPLVHPLDLLLYAANWICPSCKTSITTMQYCEPTLVVVDPADPLGLECEIIYAYEPCGCVVREILVGNAYA